MACIFKPGDKVIYKRLYGMNREYLKEGHQKRWWYIEQNDYNLYYCENEVYTEYRKIGE